KNHAALRDECLAVGQHDGAVRGEERGHLFFGDESIVQLNGDAHFTKSLNRRQNLVVEVVAIMYLARDGDAVAWQMLGGAKQQVESFVAAEIAEKQQPLPTQALFDRLGGRSIVDVPHPVRRDVNRRMIRTQKSRQLLREQIRVHEESI